MSFRIASAPRFAQFTCFDCADCGHPELGRPVFLTSESGNVAAYGSGCAARLLGTTAAEVEAKVAADTIAADEMVAAIFGFISCCLPGRITVKFTNELAARFSWATEGQLAAAVDAYKALAKVKAVRTWKELAA